MKYRSYLLLLLLLTASCASRQSVRYRDRFQADTQPAVCAVERENAAEQDAKGGKGQNTVPQTWQAQKRQALDSLCQSSIFETTQLGLYIYDLTDGQPLYAVNPAHRMRPASCQKVITAVTALNFLEPDFQFHTDFRITGTVSGGVLNGDLIVVGGMDPLVTPNELLEAARTIKQQQGISSIKGNIMLDLSMREDKEFGWGWCWDDDYGPLSALLVESKAGFGEKFLKALSKAGIKASSKLKNVPLRGETGGKQVYSIRHNIDELLVPMMKESDNIYAECLFYQTAATTGKKWAGRKEGAQKTEELLEAIGLDATQYRIADGSGLSLYNYVSAEMLVGLLRYAWRTNNIREHLLPSLPIAGIDGTLEKRMQDTEAQGNVRAKTGTVTGVSSLAGYLTAANGHTIVFAIINQGIPSASVGRAFQNQVCQELCK